jgi:broad specificity phosphatase PhoE
MPLNNQHEESAHESAQEQPSPAYPQLPDALRNRYIAWRHAPSEANKDKILATKPENAITRYGLTSEGYSEARAAAVQASSAELINPNTIFITSDFLRAEQTAVTGMHAINNTTELTTEPLLRDRDFGKYELQSTEYCPAISALDTIYPEHETNDVESVISVAKRAVAAILKCEDAYENRNIVLVSHDTPLRIMQTLFERRPAAEYQKTPYFENTEFRRLILKTLT